MKITADFSAQKPEVVNVLAHGFAREFLSDQVFQEEREVCHQSLPQEPSDWARI